MSQLLQALFLSGLSLSFLLLMCFAIYLVWSECNNLPTNIVITIILLSTGIGAGGLMITSILNLMGFKI